MNDSTVSKAGSVEKCRRSTVTSSAMPKPIAAPPADAHAKSSTTPPNDTPFDATPAASPAAARAVRSETSAVASLTSDSPSRMDTRRRGRPIRRPTAVAATASGGATTAPIAKATAKSSPSAHRRKRATPEGREEHEPHGEAEDDALVVAEVDERGLDRGGIQQRRQDAEQHDLGTQDHLGDEREVGPEDPDDDEDEGRGQVEAVGQPRAPEDGGRDGQQPDGDLHDDSERVGQPASSGATVCSKSSMPERS